MPIRKRMPLLAPLLVLVGLLTVGGAGPVLADSRPTIVSLTLDANNRAVVTWQKEEWQASLDVWWSGGDGSVDELLSSVLTANLGYLTEALDSPTG